MALGVLTDIRRAGVQAKRHDAPVGQLYTGWREAFQPLENSQQISRVRIMRATHCHLKKGDL